MLKIVISRAVYSLYGKFKGLRDIHGTIAREQLIFCLGTFSNETWLNPENIETARKCLEEHYYRFKLNQTKKGMPKAININTTDLEDLVRLPNIGPVTAVKIYRFRETYGLFKNVGDITKVEGWACDICRY